MSRMLPVLLLALTACPPSDPPYPELPGDDTDVDTDSNDTDADGLTADVSADLSEIEVTPGAPMTLYVDLDIRNAPGAVQIVIGLGHQRACAYDGSPGASYQESASVQLVGPNEPGDHDVSWSVVEAADCDAAIAAFDGANDLGSIYVLRVDDGFVHVAAASTIDGAWTTIDDPRLNDQPDLTPIVTQYWNAHSLYNAREVHVAYQPSSGRWRVGNADNSPLTENVAFHVFVADERTQAIHYTSTDALTLSHGTAVPELLGSDLVVVTSHADYGNLTAKDPLGAWYDGADWWIYNENGATFAANLDLHIVASPPGGNTMVHTASETNTSLNMTRLSNVALDGNPDAILAVTPLYAGVPVGVSIGVFYNGAVWTIFTQDKSAMPLGTQFSVMYVE